MMLNSDKGIAAEIPRAGLKVYCCIFAESMFWDLQNSS